MNNIISIQHKMNSMAENSIQIQLHKFSGPNVLSPAPAALPPSCEYCALFPGWSQFDEVLLITADP